MKLNAGSEVFDTYCESAAEFWRNNTLSPSGNSCIVVEILHEEIRVALRNLTIANALRRLIPARLIILTGIDPFWLKALCSEFDMATVRQLAEAFGADEVINIHEVVDRYVTDPGLAGHLFENLAPVITGPATHRITPADLQQNVESTICRLLLLPHPSNAQGAAEIARRSEGFAEAYHELFERLRPSAFVTSHVDYNQWGLAVEAAQRFGVPVVYTQSTGGLKAYTWFPECADHKELLRAQLTRRIAERFEIDVWPRRLLLRRSAEMIAWRSKGNLGRPSWWRGGATASVDIRTVAERAQVREMAARRLGLEPSRPVVGVFNHAVSDARGTNKEIFADLATWYEQTAQYAASCDRVSWLFLDHPAQVRYDATGFFDRLFTDYDEYSHMVFRPSSAIAKNLLWSLVDVGVTVRGSVSNELPAYGIPVIQAGWSDWSSCGFSQVADDEASYWKLLDEHIEAALDGTSMVSAEQVERARLWHWLYRSGADVASPIVPHWEELDGDEMLKSLSVHMRHVEADGDPVFIAVRRMWTRREPFLTRFDLGSTSEIEAAVLP